MPRRDAFVNRRARLPNRQLAETFDLEIGGLRVDRPIATAPSLPRSRCSTASRRDPPPCPYAQPR
jgi:hypothetical protein